MNEYMNVIPNKCGLIDVRGMFYIFIMILLYCQLKRRRWGKIRRENRISSR
jgi:hypothetical protein